MVNTKMAANTKYEELLGRGEFLNAKTFGDVKNDMIIALTDSATPNEIKIRIAEWLFQKIYINYKLKDSDGRDDIYDHLWRALDECGGIILKASYLKYQDDVTRADTALNFYMNRFRNADTKYFILQLLNDVDLMKSYLQREDIDEEELKQHFLGWMSQTAVYEQRSNILDVLLRYYENDPEVRAAYDDMRFGGKTSRSLYDDEQSAHDPEVSKCVIAAGFKLYTDHYFTVEELDALADSGTNPIDHTCNGMLKKLYRSKEDRKIIKAIHTRLTIDNAGFPYSHEGRDITVTMSMVFCSVVRYITNIFSQDVKNTLLEILREEMDAMKELCSFGYIARSVNVLQGFDEKYKIELPFYKQLYAIVSKRLMNSLGDEDKTSELVTMGSYDPDYRNFYLEFIMNDVNTYYHEIKQEYGAIDVRDNIIRVLNMFVSSDGDEEFFALNNDLICVLIE